MLLLFAAVLLISGFLLAAFLKPHPSGVGTHQQLGLPPCYFLALSGLPCPACGMTTCFSHFVRLEWIDAARCHPGGLCLAFFALITTVWILVSVIRGVSCLTSDYLEVFAVLSCVVLGIILLNWVGRIAWIYWSGF